MHENDLECNSRSINKECFRKVFIIHIFFLAQMFFLLEVVG